MSGLLRHTSTATGAAERGRELGAALSGAVRGSAAGYGALFAEHGARPEQVRHWGGQALEAVADWAPGLAAEIAGIAAGAGLEPWQLGALNARTEILGALATAGEGECSTAVLLPRGAPPRTVQTWDWHPALAGGRLLWTLEPRPGHRVDTFTEAGIAGKIGVNSAGLGLHLNVLRHLSDGPEIGVPVHIAARRILDEAATVEQAAQIARSARYSASSVLTVVTYDGSRGDARCLELSPDGVGEVAPSSGRLTHTNHFLDPRLAPGERADLAESTTTGRLARIRAAVRDPAAGPVERAAQLAEHTGSGDTCMHSDPADPIHERWDTLATITLDVAEGRLLVHPGRPCSAADAPWADSAAPVSAA